MAKVNLSTPFDEIRGALSKKDKIVNRRKTFRDDTGRVVQVGLQEAYAVKNPRNWKKNPPKGAELANITLWQEACKRASQILLYAQPDGPTELQLRVRQMNKVPDFYSAEEAQALVASYKERFNAQLPGVRGTHPDPFAPIDKTTLTGKRYIQFPAFLRAMIFHELKSSESYSATPN